MLEKDQFNGFGITGMVVEAVERIPLVGRLLVDTNRRQLHPEWSYGQRLRVRELTLSRLRGLGWRMQRAICGRPHD